MSTAIVIGALLAAWAFVLLAYRRRWAWTGFTVPPGHDGVDKPASAKTLWDWLQLLIIPLGLAIVAFALDSTQRSRDRAREERREEVARSVAADGAREDALRGYLQQMSELMLSNAGMFARNASPEYLVARTLTQTVLRQLDGRRKALVIRFLDEAGAIHFRHREQFASETTILQRADLRGVVLREHVLLNVDFGGADLRDADLRDAVIGLVTNLSYADLRGADFTGARFEPSDEPAAYLEGACVTEARFVRASLRRAALAVTGRGVDFTGADLRGADFGRARLANVRLTDANTGESSIRDVLGSLDRRSGRRGIDARCAALARP